MAELLGLTSRSVERAIIEELDRLEPAVAEEIKQRLFVFEDVALLEDRSISILIESVPPADLGMSLKTVASELRERVFRCAPESLFGALREAFDLLGNVRLRDVEAAQQRVVAVIRALEAEGKMLVAHGEDLV